MKKMPRKNISVRSGPEMFARTISLPRESKPLRLPTYPNLERTAVLAFERTFTMDVGRSSYQDFTRTSLARLPSAPLWVDTVISTYLIASEVFGSALNVDNNDIPFYAFAISAGAMPFASDGSSIYALVPSNTTYTSYPLYVEIVGGDADVTFSYTADGVVWTSVTQALTALTSTSLLVPSGHWFRILSVEVAVAGLHRIIFGNDTQSPTNAWTYLLPAGPPLEADNSALPYSDSRCTANAVLFSNVSKVLNKEGTVQSARLVSRGSVQPWGYQTSVLSQVHPAERYFGALESGSYSFTFSTAESEKFVDSVILRTTILTWDAVLGTITFGGATNCPLIDIVTPTTFNAIVLKDPDLTTTSTMAVTNNYHLEFRTTSTLFNLGYNSMPLESYHAAMVSLLRMGCFFENPTHWTDVVRAILSGIRAATPILFPSAAPLVSLATRAGERLLPTQNKPQPMSQKQLTKVDKKSRSKRGR